MVSKQKNIVITSAVRTAIGTFKGSLKGMQAHDLGSTVIKESLNDLPLYLFDIINLMARLLGVEPRTSWSVAKRSIQLSYRRSLYFLSKYMSYLKHLSGQFSAGINFLLNIFLKLLFAPKF